MAPASEPDSGSVRARAPRRSWPSWGVHRGRKRSRWGGVPMMLIAVAARPLASMPVAKPAQPQASSSAMRSGEMPASAPSAPFRPGPPQAAPLRPMAAPLRAISQGNSSRSSNSAAAGRISLAANSCATCWIMRLASESSNMAAPMRRFRRGRQLPGGRSDEAVDDAAVAGGVQELVDPRVVELRVQVLDDRVLEVLDVQADVGGVLADASPGRSRRWSPAAIDSARRSAARRARDCRSTPAGSCAGSSRGAPRRAECCERSAWPGGRSRAARRPAAGTGRRSSH